MIEIWDLYVKGLQSCWPSNFENGSAPVQLEHGPTLKAGNYAALEPTDPIFTEKKDLNPFPNEACQKSRG